MSATDLLNPNPPTPDFVIIMTKLPKDHDTLINVSVVCEIMGISRSHLSFVQTEPDWPVAVKLPSVAPMYWRSEIMAFLATRRAKPAAKAEA